MKPNYNALPTHTCAATGCQHQIRAGLLMCIDHWRMVPKAVQDDVWHWYRLLGRVPMAADRYEQAKRAAIDAVHSKQLTRKAKHDAATKPLF